MAEAMPGPFAENPTIDNDEVVSINIEAQNVEIEKEQVERII